MYVECIDKSGFEDQLTEGTAYQILEIGNNSYLIANDKEQTVWYGQSHFVIKAA